MSHSLDDFPATATCETERDYMQLAASAAGQETATTPMAIQGRGPHVMVGPGKKTVVIRYDAVAERESTLRREIAELLLKR